MPDANSLEEALAIQKAIFDKDFSDGPFSGAVQNLAYQKRVDFAKRFITDHDRVLSIGCGDGTVVKGIAQKAKKIVAIDVSPQAIKVAQEFNPADNIVYQQANVEQVEFEDKFDAVVLFEVIEHIYEPDRVLRKINKLLTRDGKLIISTPNFGRLNRRVKQLPGIKALRLKQGKDPNRIGCDHFQEYTFGELKALLAESGLDVLCREGIIFWTNTLGGKKLRNMAWLQGLNFWLGGICPEVAGHMYVAAQKRH
jgi:2-polyprenyl-3-methyl-5-hydroxy-6-metoxy-1,4-benzoquinol methylase